MTVAALHPAVPVASVQGSLALDLHPDHSPPEGPLTAGPGCDLTPVDLRTRRRLEEWARRYTQVAADVVAQAIRAYWTDTHNLAEGAGAAALAAALQEKSKLAGKRVGLILSGGNIDFDLFRTWIGTDAAPAAQRAVA